MVLISYLNISVLFPADKYIPCRDDYKIRRDMDSLQIYLINTIIPRTNPVGYTKKLETIGDHIRKWRINNHLFQADVAKRLGVCEDTIVGWEMRNIKPSVRQVLGITQLIGYL